MAIPCRILHKDTIQPHFTLIKGSVIKVILVDPPADLDKSDLQAIPLYAINTDTTFNMSTYMYNSVSGEQAIEVYEVDDTIPVTTFSVMVAYFENCAIAQGGER